MEVQSCPMRFWQTSCPRHLRMQEWGQRQVSLSADVTLEDVANWVASLIEADVPPSSPVCLDPSRNDLYAAHQSSHRAVPSTARIPLRTSMVEVPARHTPRAAVPLAAALQHAAGNWKDHWTGTRESLAWRERTFAGRKFVLWIEDLSTHECADIHACDEASGVVGTLRLPDSVLRIAFKHFVDARIGGLAEALGVGCRHHRARPSRTEPLLQEFLERLLDAIYFEANAFRDEFEIKLPGLGIPSQAEDLGFGFGPDIELAAAPGSPSKPLQDRAPRSPWSGVGRSPLAPSPLRRRLQRSGFGDPLNCQQSACHKVKDIADFLRQREPLASRLGIEVELTKHNLQESDAPPDPTSGSLRANRDANIVTDSRRTERMEPPPVELQPDVTATPAGIARRMERVEPPSVEFQPLAAAPVAATLEGSSWANARPRRPTWRPTSPALREFLPPAHLGITAFVTDPLKEDSVRLDPRPARSRKLASKDPSCFHDSATTSVATTCCTAENSGELNIYVSYDDDLEVEVGHSYEDDLGDGPTARPGRIREVSGERKPVLRREMPSLRRRSMKSCFTAKP